MIRPRVQEEDLLLILDQVHDEAQCEANGQWLSNGSPAEGVLRIIYACQRVRRSTRRSLAGVRAYETAKARGNLPPVLTRVRGLSLDGDGSLLHDESGRPLYSFERRRA